MHDPSTFCFHHFSPLMLSAVEIGVICRYIPLHFLCDFFQGSYKYSSNKIETIISDTMVILNCPSIPLLLIPPI